MSLHSADYPVLINHAELILELLWQTYTLDNIDIQVAAKILNNDHFGIQKVKERLLEYLAVRKFRKALFYVYMGHLV